MSSIQDSEVKLSKLLRLGVIISGIILAIGWLWDVIINGDHLLEFKEYQPISLLSSLQMNLVSQNYSVLLINLGLAILVMLPAARVLFTGFLFISRKEKILGWAAIFVFVVLVSSFLLGADL